MHVTKIIRPYLLVALFLSVFATACVSAPVQEMSDARQALQAAEEVGAEREASDRYAAAVDLLRRAEEALNSGDYNRAREQALAAKAAALAAREQAVNRAPNP